MKQVIITISAIALLCSCSFSVFAVQDQILAILGRGAIEDAAFSPDSKILAVFTTRGIYFHNPADFVDIAFINMGFPYGYSFGTHFICFSPDGKLLASSTTRITGRVILWNVATYEKVAEIKADGYTGSTYSIKFSPDGKLIAFGGEDGKIRLLDVVEQKEIGVLEGHNNIVSSISFSFDGSLLVSSSEDNTVKLWDMVTHKAIKTFSCQDAVRVAFSPDGKLLAVGDNQVIKLYNIKQDNERVINAGDFSYRVAFNPDGKLLLGGSIASGVKLWNVDNLREVDSLAVDCMLWLVRFSPDGHFLVCADGTDIMIWDMKAQKKIETLDEYISLAESAAITISSDGRFLVVGDNRVVKLWDIESHKLLSVFKTIKFPVGGEVTSVAISPDSRLLSAGMFNTNEVMLWDIKENKTTVIDTQLSSITTVAFSPDSKLLAFGGPEGLELCDTETKKRIPLDGDPGPVWCSAFTTDGKLLLSGGDNAVHIWDMKKLKMTQTIEQSSATTYISLSSNSRWLAVGLVKPSQVKLYDMLSLKEAASFIGSYDNALNNNGCLLATTSGFDTDLWNVAKRSKVATLLPDAYIRNLCFSPDGGFLVCGCLGGEVILLDMQTYAEICNGQPVESNGKLATAWGGIKSENLETPSSFVLGQNYPNPFNPETWIPYQLKEAGNVSIDIYDANGHLIRNFYLGRKEAGVYNDRACAVYWDGRNEKGERVSSGVYFYILRTDSLQSKPRKMILLK